MGEPKSISTVINEVTDKTGKAGYFLVIEEPNESGNPTTYKISLNTLLEGILAPDGLGDIDIDNNNLINVNNIDAATITAAGGALTGLTNLVAAIVNITTSIQAADYKSSFGNSGTTDSFIAWSPGGINDIAVTIENGLITDVTETPSS